MEYASFMTNIEDNSVVIVKTRKEIIWIILV